MLANVSLNRTKNKVFPAESPLAVSGYAEVGGKEAIPRERAKDSVSPGVAQMPKKVLPSPWFLHAVADFLETEPDAI